MFSIFGSKNTTSIRELLIKLSSDLIPITSWAPVVIQDWTLPSSSRPSFLKLSLRGVLRRCSPALSLPHLLSSPLLVSCSAWYRSWWVTQRYLTTAMLTLTFLEKGHVLCEMYSNREYSRVSSHKSQCHDMDKHTHWCNYCIKNCQIITISSQS